MRASWKRLGAVAALAGALFSAGLAHAQGAVQQYGVVAPFHVGAWLQNYQTMDAGTPNAPFVSALGLFNGSGCPLGVSSQSSPGQVATPYSLFTVCNTGSAVRFTFAGVNGQATPNVYFNIGGVDYLFPFGGGGSGVLSLNGLSGLVNITAGANVTVTPSGQNIVIAATGGGGGGGVTSVATDTSLTGGPITTTGTLSRAALTGDITAAGGSNATTLATVNANTGTWGSTTAIPTVTLDGKGRATAAGQTTITAALDAAFGNAQGNILYRGASAWAALTPGTNGFVLSTQGAAADPHWVATSGGGGTVTSITCNGGLTGGTITGAGTCSLASPTAHGVLVGAGSSPIAATTAGTTGQVLTSNGASADPTFQAIPAQTTLASIAALRALTTANPSAVQQVRGYTTAGLGGGTFLYVAADVTTTDNNCTIFVDASSRRWYRQYSGPINVQWCGAQGDGSTDDTTAIGYALSGFRDVYLPSTATFYKISGTLTIAQNGQSVRGDGPGSAQGGAPAGGGTTIATTSASLPVFKLNDRTFAVQISNLLIDRSATATAGGNGIDSLANETENALFSNVVIQHQWFGFALGVTNGGVLQNCVATSNQNTGVYMLASATAGVMQWTMYNVFSLSNGAGGNAADGFSVNASATGGGMSLGTMFGGGTFANAGHGYAAYGVNLSNAINGVRIVGSFFGQDNNDEIYLNTYGGYHILEPTILELAGTSSTGVGLLVAPSGVGSGINITPNNVDVYVQVGKSNGNSYDGLLVAANLTGSHVSVVGGNYSNNGAAALVSRRNGINVFSASNVAISGVTAYGNFIGLASNVDSLSVAGSDFTGNTSSYAALPGGMTVSCLAGNRPVAVNSCGGSTGPYLALAGGTMTGNIVMGGNNLTGAGLLTATTTTTANLSGATVTGNLVLGSNNITSVGSVTYSTDLTASGSATTHLTAGAIAMSGGITIASGSMNFTTTLPGTSNGINAVDNITVRNSLGVGTAANGTIGYIDWTGSLQNVSGTSGQIFMQNAGVTTFLAQVSNGNLYVQKNLGVGLGASGTGAGKISVSTSIDLNGTPYTNP